MNVQNTTLVSTGVFLVFTGAPSIFANPTVSSNHGIFTFGYLLYHPRAEFLLCLGRILDLIGSLRIEIGHKKPQQNIEGRTFGWTD